ncbi:hypothetical protein G9A89_000518, partial [Geosiphon pyriformis]
MKQSNPEVFKQAIKCQIKILADQWVIKIQGFTPDIIAFTHDKIMESWATAIVPTKNTDKGEWKILVDRKDHGNTIAWLQEYWEEILDLNPPEIVESSPFDEQKVASKNNALMDTWSEHWRPEIMAFLWEQHVIGHKFLVSVTDFFESDTNFWFQGVFFGVRTLATWCPDARNYFASCVHKPRDYGYHNEGPLPSPRHRFSGAELGTFAALSSSSISAYQAPY